MRRPRHRSSVEQAILIGKALLGLERSRTRLGEPVGACAVFEEDGHLHYFSAGNVEYGRAHVARAETLAILLGVGERVAKGRTIVLKAVCVAAQSKDFSPCGRCMDLVREFGSKDCQVIHYNPATRKERLLAGL